MAKQELIPYLSAKDLKKDYSADYRNNRKHHWTKLIFIRLPQKRKKKFNKLFGHRNQDTKLYVKTFDFSHVGRNCELPSPGPPVRALQPLSLGKKKE